MLNIRPNIFRKKFLESLGDQLDGAPTLGEAKTAGPWQVVPKTAGHRTQWTLKRDSHPEPFAVLRFRETAHLLAAILPGCGRHPVYGLTVKGGKSELMTSFGEQGFTCIGEMRTPEHDVLAHLHTAHCLLSSRESLAWFLMAAPPETLEGVGQIVAHRLRDLKP